MSAFIMGALGFCIVFVLLAISVQLIRIERAIEEAVRLVEVRVKQEYASE